MHGDRTLDLGGERLEIVVGQAGAGIDGADDLAVTHDRGGREHGNRGAARFRSSDQLAR
ncbi:hypothetical protein D3C87_1665150 [compost metagenome]